jgi:hypothetical protein
LLTYTEHGQSFVVRPGTTITVHLSRTSILQDWTLPVARYDDSQLIRVGTHKNSDGSVDATFVAASSSPNKVIIVSWADGHSISGTVDFGVAITVAS